MTNKNTVILKCNNCKRQYKDELNICSWNIQGIMSKSKNKLIDQDFLDVIKCHDIACLVETHANNSVDLNVEDYHVFQVNRPKHMNAFRNYGGIAILIRQSLKQGLKVIKTTSDMIWVKLDREFWGTASDIFLCATYIPPRNSTYNIQQVVDIIDLLQNDIQEFSSKGDIIVCGDLNARTGNAMDFIQEDSDQYIPLSDNYFIDSCVTN